MKWQVRFRQQQQNCCPPGKYWVVRTEIVESPTAQQAQAQVMSSWRYNHPIEIKDVKEFKDDNKKQQGEHDDL